MVTDAEMEWTFKASSLLPDCNMNESIILFVIRKRPVYKSPWVTSKIGVWKAALSEQWKYVKIILRRVRLSRDKSEECREKKRRKDHGRLMLLEHISTYPVCMGYVNWYGIHRPMYQQYERVLELAKPPCYVALHLDIQLGRWYAAIQSLLL